MEAVIFLYSWTNSLAVNSNSLRHCQMICAMAGLKNAFIHWTLRSELAHQRRSTLWMFTKRHLLTYYSRIAD